jgi:hypothetical protein
MAFDLRPLPERRRWTACGSTPTRCAEEEPA